MLLSGTRKAVIYPAIAFVVAQMAACSFPKTAEEFRKAAPGAMFGKTKTIEVKRPYATISAMFRRKAAECLNGELSVSDGRSTKIDKIVTKVTPSKSRTELVTNYTYGGATIGQPDDGIILLVADASPVNAKTTKIDFYYGTAVRVVESIEVWAEGEERGCPDLTRIMEKS